MSAERLFIKRIDERYVIPSDIEVIRVVAWEQVPNNDGGTGWHWEYICVVREVES